MGRVAQPVEQRPFKADRKPLTQQNQQLNAWHSPAFAGIQAQLDANLDAAPWWCF
jgi:hypothetical protein